MAARNHVIGNGENSEGVYPRFEIIQGTHRPPSPAIVDGHRKQATSNIGLRTAVDADDDEDAPSDFAALKHVVPLWQPAAQHGTLTVGGVGGHTNTGGNLMIDAAIATYRCQPQVVALGPRLATGAPIVEEQQAPVGSGGLYLLQPHHHQAAQQQVTAISVYQQQPTHPPQQLVGAAASSGAGGGGIVWAPYHPSLSLQQQLGLLQQQHASQQRQQQQQQATAAAVLLANGAGIVSSGYGCASATVPPSPSSPQRRRKATVTDAVNAFFNSGVRNSQHAAPPSSLMAMQPGMLLSSGGSQQQPMSALWQPQVQYPPPHSESASTSSSMCSGAVNYCTASPTAEIYSRKVFVGGIPYKTAKRDIEAAFSRFGELTIEEPINYRHHTTNNGGSTTTGHSMGAFEIKGFVFLIFKWEHSVKLLIDSCDKSNGRISGLFVELKFDNSERNYDNINNTENGNNGGGWAGPTNNTIGGNGGSLRSTARVEIRPWRLEDADFSELPNADVTPVDARKAVFVGGVPRQMTAGQLAENLAEQFGPVAYTGIDTDGKLQYPKGAGRAVFIDHHSFTIAVAAKVAHLKTTRVDKVVEVKPYVIEEIRWCDECQTTATSNCAYDDSFSAFCDHISCLQFYCESCWERMHRVGSVRVSHVPQKKPPRRWMISGGGASGDD